MKEAMLQYHNLIQFIHDIHHPSFGMARHLILMHVFLAHNSKIIPCPRKANNNHSYYAEENNDSSEDDESEPRPLCVHIFCCHPAGRDCCRHRGLYHKIAGSCRALDCIADCYLSFRCHESTEKNQKTVKALKIRESYNLQLKLTLFLGYLTARWVILGRYHSVTTGIMLCIA